MLLLLAAGLFVSLKLIGIEQIFKSHASAEPIVVTGTNIKTDEAGKKYTEAPTVELELDSPLGPVEEIKE